MAGHICRNDALLTVPGPENFTTDRKKPWNFSGIPLFKRKASKDGVVEVFAKKQVILESGVFLNLLKTSGLDSAGDVRDGVALPEKRFQAFPGNKVSKNAKLLKMAFSRNSWPEHGDLSGVIIFQHLNRGKWFPRVLVQLPGPW